MGLRRGATVSRGRVNSSSGGIGRPKKWPCPRWTPRPPSCRHCSSVSTPSAQILAPTSSAHSVIRLMVALWWSEPSVVMREMSSLTMSGRSMHEAVDVGEAPAPVVDGDDGPTCAVALQQLRPRRTSSVSECSVISSTTSLRLPARARCTWTLPQRLEADVHRDPETLRPVGQGIGDRDRLERRTAADAGRRLEDGQRVVPGEPAERLDPDRPGGAEIDDGLPEHGGPRDQGRVRRPGRELDLVPSAALGFVESPLGRRHHAARLRVRVPGRDTRRRRSAHLACWPASRRPAGVRRRPTGRGRAGRTPPRRTGPAPVLAGAAPDHAVAASRSSSVSRRCPWLSLYFLKSSSSMRATRQGCVELPRDLGGAGELELPRAPVGDPGECVGAGQTRPAEPPGPASC